MNKENVNKNLTNAFRLVKQTLDEASILLSDIDELLTNEDSPFKSLHTGYEIGTESSNSLNVGEKWLKRFAMRYYLPKSEDGFPKYLIGASVSYNFKNHPEQSPKLLLGIIENNMPKANKEAYYYWWISFLFDSDKTHNYTPKANSEGYLKPSTWYEVDPSPSEAEKIPLFKKGYLYFVDLVDINSKEQVNRLAEELTTKFEIIE